MTTLTWPKHHGLVVIALAVASVAVYMLMIGITLAHLMAVSGQIPLDMRPFGYHPRDVTELFNGLGEAGRRYYLNRQIPLDFAYPALLGLTLIFTIGWFGRRVHIPKLARISIAFSVGAAVFDYCENVGIITMILGWPDFSNTLAYATSAASVAKSFLTTGAVSLVLWGAVIWARQRRTHQSG